MLLRPLKRVAVPGSSTAELVEPSAGLASAFINKLSEMPKNSDGDGVAGQYFSALRIMICLYDDGKPFLATYVNDLHEFNPELWPLTVSPEDGPRSVVDALDAGYIVRVVDSFLDNMTVTQMEEFNALIKQSVWIDRDASKNEATPTT